MTSHKFTFQHLSNFPGPVIEKNPETGVITQWPASHSDFPWIAGVMANEGQLFTECIYRNILYMSINICHAFTLFYLCFIFA